MASRLSQRVLEFTAYGLPIPKGSVTAFKTKARAVITPANLKLGQWTQAIRSEAGKAMSGPLWDGPIALRATFVFARPKTVKRRYHTVKPDLDKLFRALGDAMKGIVITEDARFYYAELTKVYGERPGVWVLVREVES